MADGDKKLVEISNREVKNCQKFPKKPSSRRFASSKDLEALDIKKFSSGDDGSHHEVKKTRKNLAKPKRLPQLLKCKARTLENVFIEKLRFCSKNYSTVQLGYLKRKLKYLSEFLEYLKKGRAVPECAYPAIVDMFAGNVFRVLPPRQFVICNELDYIEEFSMVKDPDTETTQVETACDFFLMFMESPKFNPPVLKKCLNEKFLSSLLYAFDTDSPVERNFLKTVLHRIYQHFTVLRSFIRKEIACIFQTFVYETDQHSGIAEILEVYSAIICGFVRPLKEEHKRFFLRALLPLHVPTFYFAYHLQITNCVRDFLSKDPNLAEPFFRWILLHWPKFNSSKEMRFLCEIEEVLSTEVVDVLLTREDTRLELLKRLETCKRSPHNGVAEKAKDMLDKNELLQTLSLSVGTNLEEILKNLNISNF